MIYDVRIKNRPYITNTTKGRPPRLPFSEMKNDVLGDKYELSVVFAGDARMRTLNNTYRKKDAPASVLAFPLEEKKGEIFINLPRARRDARRARATLANHLIFLFIHALLHLKGLSHGSTMEKEERKWMKKFNFS